MPQLTGEQLAYYRRAELWRFVYALEKRAPTGDLWATYAWLGGVPAKALGSEQGPSSLPIPRRWTATEIQELVDRLRSCRTPDRSCDSSDREAQRVGLVALPTILDIVEPVAPSTDG